MVGKLEPTWLAVWAPPKRMAVWSSKVPSDARMPLSLSMKRAMQAHSIFVTVSSTR